MLPPHVPLGDPAVGTPPVRAAGEPAGSALAPELRELLRTMRAMVEELPYPQRGPRRSALSAVYVRQTVAAPVEIRRWREDEFDEPVIVEEERHASRLSQPFDEVAEQHDHLVIEGAAFDSLDERPGGEDLGRVGRPRPAGPKSRCDAGASPARP
mgnify:CR=1 FL=1